MAPFVIRISWAYRSGGLFPDLHVHLHAQRTRLDISSPDQLFPMVMVVLIYVLHFAMVTISALHFSLHAVTTSRMVSDSNLITTHIFGVWF